MRTIGSALLALACSTGTALAQSSVQTLYLARTYNPANPGLARSAGAPALVANQDYVKALARIVYYWAYPAIDVTSRTSMTLCGNLLSRSLLGVKQTSLVALQMSASDPKRTSVGAPEADPFTNTTADCYR